MENEKSSIPYRITLLMAGHSQLTITGAEPEELDDWITSSISRIRQNGVIMPDWILSPAITLTY